MKALRRIHLYLGVFFAPILLFFIITGWYQTVTVNRQKAIGEAEDWVSKMTSVHVDQVYPSETAESYSTGAFQVFVVLMSIALIITLLLGVILAFKSLRVKWPVWVSLVLGFVVPILLLWLGQKR